jgi:LysR family transcriptional regulator of beta-lactamase
LESPRDLESIPLLRSYRSQEWPAWFAAAGVEPPHVSGPVFDSLSLMVQAAVQGAGACLAPPSLFGRELHARELVQPFSTTVEVGSYWLTSLVSRPETPAMAAFRLWCQSPDFHQAAYGPA